MNKNRLNIKKKKITLFLFFISIIFILTISHVQGYEMVKKSVINIRDEEKTSNFQNKVNQILTIYGQNISENSHKKTITYQKEYEKNIKNKLELIIQKRLIKTVNQSNYEYTFYNQLLEIINGIKKNKNLEVKNNKFTNTKYYTINNRICSDSCIAFPNENKYEICMNIITSENTQKFCSEFNRNELNQSEISIELIDEPLKIFKALNIDNNTVIIHSNSLLEHDSSTQISSNISFLTDEKKYFSTNNTLSIIENLNYCGIKEYSFLKEIKEKLKGSYLIDLNNCIISDTNSHLTFNRSEINLNENKESQLNNSSNKIYFHNKNRYEEFSFNRSACIRQNNLSYIFFKESSEISFLLKVCTNLNNNEGFYLDNKVIELNKNFNLTPLTKNLINNQSSESNTTIIPTNLLNQTKSYDIESIGNKEVCYVAFTHLDPEEKQEKYLNYLKLFCNKIIVSNIEGKYVKNIKNSVDILKNGLEIYSNELNKSVNKEGIIILFNYAAKWFYENINESNYYLTNSTLLFLKEPVINLNKKSWFRDYIISKQKDLKHFIATKKEIKMKNFFSLELANKTLIKSLALQEFNKNNENTITSSFAKDLMILTKKDKYPKIYSNLSTVQIANSIFGLEKIVGNQDDVEYIFNNTKNKVKNTFCTYYGFDLIEFEDEIWNWLSDLVFCDSYNGLYEITGTYDYRNKKLNFTDNRIPAE